MHHGIFSVYHPYYHPYQVSTGLHNLPYSQHSCTFCFHVRVNILLEGEGNFCVT